jgi:hypothetical protein
VPQLLSLSNQTPSICCASCVVRGIFKLQLGSIREKLFEGDDDKFQVKIPEWLNEN